MSELSAVQSDRLHRKLLVAIGFGLGGFIGVGICVAAPNLRQKPQAAARQDTSLQVSPAAVQSKIDGLQIQVDAANRRAQEEAETVIDLQRQLDKANALVEQEADEALTAQQERDDAQANTHAASEQVLGLSQQLATERRVEAVRINSVIQASHAACRAQLLHTEAEIKLLPISGPAKLAIQILEAAIQQAAAERAQQAQQSAPTAYDSGAEGAGAAGPQ